MLVKSTKGVEDARERIVRRIGYLKNRKSGIERNLPKIRIRCFGFASRTNQGKGKVKFKMITKCRKEFQALLKHTVKQIIVCSPCIYAGLAGKILVICQETSLLRPDLTR